MRISPIQNDFSGGEFSPMSSARSDHPRYKTGVAKAKNALPLLQGPIQGRSGTRYIGQTSIVGARLIPFKYSDSQAYMLEFGQNIIRFYKNRGPVMDGLVQVSVLTPYSISNVQELKFAQSLDQLFVVSPNHPPMVLSRFSDTQWTFVPITFSDGPYLNEGLIPQLAQVTNTAANPVLVPTLWDQTNSTAQLSMAWLKPQSNISGVHTANGQFVVTMSSPAIFNDGDTVTITGITGTVTNGDNPNGTWQVTKMDDSNYALRGPAVFDGGSIAYAGGGLAIGYATVPEITFMGNDAGQFMVTLNMPDVFSDGSTVTVFNTPTAPGAQGTWKLKKNSPTNYTLLGSVYAPGYVPVGGDIIPALFVNTDVGRFIRLKTGDGQPWIWGIIQSVVNPTTVNISLQQKPSIFPPIVRFAMGAWGATTGYPNVIAFHQQRLWFAGPQLQTLYGSVIGEYTNFAPSSHTNRDGSLNKSGAIADSDAVTFVISSNDNHAIVWMTSDEYGMPIGTLGGVFVMKASSINEAITPTNIDIKRVDSVGCANTIPIYIGKSTIYLSLSTRKLYELTYYYNIDGYRRTDLTEIATNITGAGVLSNPTVLQMPQPILWMARQDGTILSCTFERSLDALRTGWAQHQLGGQSTPSGNAPIVSSLASIPDPTGTFDDLWMTVTRYINGNAIQTIEVLEKLFEDFNKPENYYGVDAGATYDKPLYINTATNGATTEINIVGHGLANGDNILVSEVDGFKDEQKVVCLEGKFPVTVLDPDNFSVPLDSSYLTTMNPAYPSGKVRKIVSQVSGLTWLEGETVSLLGDGEPIGSAQVVGGVVILPVPSAVVQIGYGYDIEVQGLRIEGGSQDGTSMGKYRRINQLGVSLNRSHNFEVGVDFKDMVPVSVSQNSDDQYQESKPLFTGIINRIGVVANYDYQNQWTFRVKTPTPFQLLAVYPQMETNDYG